MSERINKTSICSVVFLDIIDYSKMSVSDQIECKEHFNALIGEAIKDVAQNDRIIIDTGDGAAISLMGAPEEALFVSMTIRDGVLKINKQGNQQIFVRIGINLGPVRVVSDINGQPNVIGDGINVAQRVMSFAGPNQILVSRSYYEVTSRLTKEITGMFTYSGVKHDKHVREHEVYAIRASSEEEPVKTDTPEPSEETPDIKAEQSGNINKKVWVAVGALLVGLVLAFFLSSGRHTDTPESPTSDTSSPSTPQPAMAPAAPAPADTPTASREPAAPAAQTATEEPKKKPAKRKKPKSENAQKDSASTTGSEAHPNSSVPPSAPEPTNTHSQEKPTEKPAEKSLWESMKQGGKKECTQGEIALHQCH